MICKGLKPNALISCFASSAVQPCSAIRKAAIIIPTRSSPKRQWTNTFFCRFCRSSVRKRAKILSFGNGQCQGIGTYSIPSFVTTSRSCFRERTQLATVEGAQTPYPYGGKQRQIQVDIDLAALQAKGLAPADVVSAINAQNLIAPSGTMKIDRFEYAIETNSAPSIVEALNNLPIRTV